MPIASQTQKTTVGYSVLHRFRGGTDGEDPYGGLVEVNGSLYGTTLDGGRGAACKFGCGTVFKLSGNGHESVVYAFQGGSDGAYPNGLIYHDDRFYGTTEAGGLAGKGCGMPSAGCGVVFAIDLKGRERVLYRFQGGFAGGLTFDGLTARDGVLYGTTWYGGGRRCGDECGLVFAVTKSGNFRQIYAFKNPPDGDEPNGPLLAKRGLLFGTTYHGGYGSREGSCCGTVFVVSRSGTEHVLCRFKPGDPAAVDGFSPEGGLVDVRGELYGTTTGGGFTSSSWCGIVGCGVVFAVMQTGAERIVYRFTSFADGLSPTGTLLWDGQTFYGTTDDGGVPAATCSQGCGVVFSLTPSGNEQTLYRFGGGTDGSYPSSTLLSLNGTLYGVTEIGGGSGCQGAGCGTVFALRLPKSWK